jgi:glycine betaine/proline transport system substrate-binding protein
VREKMSRDIQGINPGAGITRFSIHMMVAYGLEEVGYRFHTGSEKACFDAFEQAVEHQQWVVVPLWQPQFLHHKHRIRDLDDPRGLLGGVDRAVLLLRDDRRVRFTPEQLARLDALRFSNAIIAELDHQVQREGQCLDAVTRAWLDTHPF